jgi:hypothetical protein
VDIYISVVCPPLGLLPVYLMYSILSSAEIKSFHPWKVKEFEEVVEAGHAKFISFIQLSLKEGGEGWQPLLYNISKQFTSKYSRYVYTGDIIIDYKEGGDWPFAWNPSVTGDYNSKSIRLHKRIKDRVQSYMHGTAIGYSRIFVKLQYIQDIQ